MKVKTKYNLGQCVLFADYGGLNVGTINSIDIKLDYVFMGCKKIEYTILTETLNGYGNHSVKDVNECAIKKVLNKKEYDKEYTKQLAKLTAQKVAKELEEKDD